MDKFNDLTGKIVPLENGGRFFISEHCITYSDDGWVDAQSVSCNGFFYRPYVVNGFREVSGGFFGLKKIHFFDKEVHLYNEMELYEYNRIRGKKSEILIMRTPDDFPYTVGELSKFRGGPRVVLGMDYIDLLRFRINYSKIIGGDDLNLFGSEWGLFGSLERNRFIDTLSVCETVEVSTLDFKVNE